MMNGEEFYQEFKDILYALGISWGDKEQVKVRVKEHKIVFETNERKIVMKVKK